MINKFTTSVGEHIIVRGEEFIVQKTDKLGDDNSFKITAMGVSELTRGHTFIFRTDLESPDEIKKLEPKNVTSLRFLHEVVSPLTQGPWGSGSDFWGISEFVSLITHGRIAPPDRGQAIGESSGGVGMVVGSAVWRR